MDLNISQIKKAIEKAVPIKFSSYTLSHETVEKLDKILELFLDELGEERIKNQLSYCMRELAENGRKACLGRRGSIMQWMGVEDVERTKKDALFGLHSLRKYGRRFFVMDRKRLVWFSLRTRGLGASKEIDGVKKSRAARSSSDAGS